jgi:ParB-like chromosome segregation protein Spo0J
MKARTKVDHKQLSVPLNRIQPSPENALLYHPVTPDDQATIELAESIREHNVLVATVPADNVVVRADDEGF